MVVATDSTIEIVPGRLFGLCNPVSSDGSRCRRPDSDGVATSSNCFLLVEDGHAVLFGTGFSVHEQALLAQLDELVDGRRLSVVVPTVEFPSMCNARPIADRFDVDVCYQKFEESPADYLNFRPEHRSGDAGGLDGIKYSLDKVVPVGQDGRQLELFLPVLRLLPSNWGYDRETGTLFSGDLFGWVPRADTAGPWVADGEDDDQSTPETVLRALLENRYWWLAGADTEPLRDSFTTLRETMEISTIAPEQGPVLTGAAVSRHFGLLDEALIRAAGLPAHGVAAGAWPAKR